MNWMIRTGRTAHHCGVLSRLPPSSPSRPSYFQSLRHWSLGVGSSPHQTRQARLRSLTTMAITPQGALHYVNLCGAHAGLLTKEALLSSLRRVARDDIIVQGDGVVYGGDLHGIDALADALMKEHACYKHLRYEPVAVAVNKEDKVGVVAVKYQLQNVGSVGGTPPSNGVSEGLLLNKLEFDDAGRVRSSLVCRQLTPEERQAKLEAPEEHCCPAQHAHVLADITAQPVSKDQHEAMQQAIRMWVDCWSSEGPSMAEVKEILHHGVQMYDGYGLHSHHAKDRTGAHLEPAGPEPKEQACSEVGATREKMQNKNELVGWAVAEDMLVGFEHWRAHARNHASQQEVPVQGLDMIVFSPDCKIKNVLQFTMKPYKGLKNRSA